MQSKPLRRDGVIPPSPALPRNVAAAPRLSAAGASEPAAPARDPRWPAPKQVVPGPALQPRLIAAPAALDALDAAAKARFCKDAADALEKNAAVFMNILCKVDTHFGADYELKQAIKTLRGAELHELRYLESAGRLPAVAVYGSRNIPLYTLVMHALIPGLCAKDVWFRTPKQTGALYVELFEELARQLPAYDLSNIHLLPNVYYDEFYKSYVLGLNGKGKRLRDGMSPASAVIFVGSSETGEGIKDQIVKKLGQLGPALPEVRQTFLMFGTGLNPVVVTPLAKGKLEAPVRDAVLSVKINNAQDCIAPKLYAVHGSVLPDFKKQLLAALKQLRFGALDDPRADYTPLTFTERVDELKAFRETHQKYLANPDAVLDPETRRVDPHVFVFPYAKLKSGEVELRDHYAPFLVLFSYDTEKELKEIATDPRVRDRAMFASLYGDASSTDMWKLRKAFEDNFHSTTLNLSVFDEESGNFPFGGYGGKASSLTIIDKDAGANVTTTRVDRPLLFSKVVAETFGDKALALPPATVLPARPHPKSAERLQLILKAAVDPATQRGPLGMGYKDLRDMQLVRRPRGLAYLRQEIAKGGLRSVFFDLFGDRPLARRDTKERMERFYGTPLVAVTRGESRARAERVPGVLLHSSPVGWDVPPMNSVRGDVNPHMGFGLLTPLLSDRVNEFHAVDAVWPGLMPPAESVADMLASGAVPPAWEAERQRVRRILNAVIGAGRAPTEAERAELKQALVGLVQGFMTAVQGRFPKGAFLKNYGECTTGDLGIQITSFHYNVDNLVGQYMGQFGDLSGSFGWYAREAAQSGRQAIDSPELLNQLNFKVFATGTKFITKLLSSPGDLLAQERMKIAKTPLGFNKEIRVDYIDGEPVCARARFSHEYLREEEEEALAVMRELFARAPEELRYLCGGADLVKLEDGSWKLVELNPGPYSGSIAARVFPIETNRFVSVLQGKPTWLMAELEALCGKPPEEQRAYFKAMHTEEEKWQKRGLEEISVAEVAKYVRDRALDRWRQEPTRENAEKTLAALREAFEGVNSPTVRDLALLVRGAEDYLNAKLL